MQNEPIFPGTKIGNLVFGQYRGADSGGQLYVALLEPAKLRVLTRILPAPFRAAGPVRQQLETKLARLGQCRSPHLAQAVLFEPPNMTVGCMIVSSLGNCFSHAERMTLQDASQRLPTMDAALELLGSGSAGEGVDEAQKILPLLRPTEMRRPF